jgi:hypothetical protein
LRAVRRLLLLVLSATLVLAACGDDDDDDALDDAQDEVGDAVDAGNGDGDGDGVDCPVSRTEVRAVVGVEVSGPRAEGAGSGCSFEFAQGTGTVAVRVFRGTGEESHEAFLTAFDDAEELEVDGNDAAWAASVGTLDVVAGDDGFQVQIFEAMGDDIPDERAAAIALAELLLDKR